MLGRRLVPSVGLVNGRTVVRLALVLDVGHVAVVTVHGVVHSLDAAVGQVDEVGAGGVLAIAFLVMSEVRLVILVVDLVAILKKGREY